MKRPIAKQSDEPMKWFTRHLFIRFNSDDEEIADAADAEWEAALESYSSHLEAIRELMPAQIEQLAGLTLHDAEFLSFYQSVDPILAGPQWSQPNWSALAVLTLQTETDLVNLVYTLWEKVKIHPPPKDWAFASDKKHWLFDELDQESRQFGAYIHRVLLSDGSVLQIPLVSVLVHSFSVQGDSQSLSGRLTA